ncbi:hypothetical protein CMI37_29520 [Candidatus Pacearchaeota archaeon]|nr:hypothetical protein [Candidatus Pacearchaeota archaeon]|tara:strand:- start:5096 stop:6193 length:1098 start_codon:yes stop_codon:yes gene_type:complete
MAFKDTSGTIIIDAVFTDIGRQRLAKGTFQVSKFALGDDEIDYALYSAVDRWEADFDTALTASTLFEAYGNRMKNIQYGLVSYDVSSATITSTQEEEDPSHAWIEYLPVLKINNKVSTAVTTGSSGIVGDSFYYLSVNSETTQKLNTIFSTGSFKFLRSNDVDKVKVVIESGLDVIPNDASSGVSQPIDYTSREEFLTKKYLLDQYFFVFADNRFIEKSLGISKQSVFRNFPAGQAEINFESLLETIPISYENQFEHHATYLIHGVNNYISDFESVADPLPSIAYSSLAGPKGTVTAMNFIVNGELKNNSTGTRDFRYNKFGQIDQLLFDGTNKFDYIDTTAYVLGVASNARVQIPLRLIRYAGT